MLEGVEIGEGLQVQLDAQVDTGKEEEMNVMYRPNPVQSPWAAKPEDKPAPSKFDNPFTVDSHKSVFYDRSVPDRFS